MSSPNSQPSESNHLASEVFRDTLTNNNTSQEFKQFIDGIQNPALKKQIELAWKASSNNRDSLTVIPDAVNTGLSKLIGVANLNLDVQTTQGITLAVTQSANDSSYKLRA